MKIKLNSEYEEISIMCVKKKGKIKIIFIDEDTNEIVSEQIIEDLIIDFYYNL